MSHYLACWKESRFPKNKTKEKRFFWCLNFDKNVTKQCYFKGGSLGLVVMGGDSYPEGRGFKTQHCILHGHFSHIFVVKNFC